MKFRPFRLIALFLCFVATPIAASSQAESAAAEDEPSAYVIRSVDFEVKGKTIPFVMRQKIEADGSLVGRSFPDLESLEALIESKRMTLASNRVFESVEASYTLEGAEDGTASVSIVFSVTDTWNIMAFPMPDYSSDSGFKLYIKGKDYNFLGSMEPLTLNLSYVDDADGDKSFAAYASFHYPFKAFSYEWDLGITEDFEIWFDDGIFSSSTNFGLTMNIPDFGFPASVTLSSGFNYNADQPTADELDPFFLSHGIGFNASMPTGLELGSFGPISYGFSAGLSMNWWPGDDMDVGGRSGFSLRHGDSLSAGRVDWIGNTRRGSKVSLGSSQSIHMDTSALTWDISAVYEGYASFWEGRAGIAAKVAALARPDTRAGNPIGISDSLRGIRGGRANCEAALVTNITLPIKLFDFPTHVLIKKDWLDFEFHIQPFGDLAIAVPDWSSLKPNMDWIWAAGGLEFVVYPKRFRSVIVRAGIGFDALSVLANKSLTAPSPRDGASPYEIYFTTGLHY